MFRLVLVSVLAAMCSAQQYHKDPKTAAILSEQRYLQGDGKFGAAYTQEDGINFKEETDADGTRRGSYSYIDPSGQKKTVSYTAGKHGFVASGDHLPVAPAPPPHAAQGPAPATPQQQYNNNAGPATFGRSYEGAGNDYEDGQYDPRYNDPSFSGNALPAGRQSYNAPAQQYQPQPQQAYRAPQPQPAYNPAPVYQQPQQQQQQQQNYNHIPQTPYYTTENPHRFQPPGKLSLSRTPDGFSYTFAKQ